MNVDDLLESIAEVVKNPRLKCRVKTSFLDAVSDWSPYMGRPAESYYEFKSCGPVAVREIEWIDIDPVVVTRRGKLVPNLREDKREALVSALKEREILFEDMGEFLRINIRGDV